MADSTKQTFQKSGRKSKIISLKQLQSLYEKRYLSEYSEDDVGRLTNVTKENVLASAGIVNFMHKNEACYITRFDEDQKREIARLLWAVLDDALDILDIGGFEFTSFMASTTPKVMKNDFEGVRLALLAKYEEKIRKGKISLDEIENRLKNDPPKSFLDALELLLGNVYVDADKVREMESHIPEDIRIEFERVIALFDECDDVSTSLGANVQSIKGYRDTIPIEAAIEESPKKAIRMLKPVVRKFIKTDPVVDIDQLIDQVTQQVEDFAKRSDFDEKVKKAKKQVTKEAARLRKDP